MKLNCVAVQDPGKYCSASINQYVHRFQTFPSGIRAPVIGEVVLLSLWKQTARSIIAMLYKTGGGGGEGYGSLRSRKTVA